MLAGKQIDATTAIIVIIKRANYQFGNCTSTIRSKLKNKLRLLDFELGEFLKGCLNSGFDLDTCR